MCGIYFSLGNERLDEKRKGLLGNRGPDSQSVITYENLLFCGFVLWQQGDEITPQPVETENIILLFNGDIFNIENLKCNASSDVSWLAERLSACETEIDIHTIFKSIQGPYSIIFYNKRTDVVYFARDSFGRNSLLIERDATSLRILSTSVVPETAVKTVEIPCLGLFRLNIRTPNRIELFPWTTSLIPLNFEPITDIVDEIECIKHIPLSPDWMCTASYQKDVFDFYELCNVGKHSSVELFQELLENIHVAAEIDKFSFLLEKSVQHRVRKTTAYCNRCIVEKNMCHHSKIAILFSGGIDCSILAVLVNKFADVNDSIDLINFACESNKSNDWNVPDRISAKLSLEDLKVICPLRKWNFIEVNVTRENCKKSMAEHIKHLIYPLNTVLDESLGTAFWFAARGEGILENTSHKSSARVVIIGSGADELFGGYRRHRNAYIRCRGTNTEKNSSVEKELEMDWLRIASRNLGRDDRIVGDTCKTLRAPFIEEELVQYVRNLKVNQLSCYLLEDGVGDKLFLRLYGYKLGLTSSSFFKKRAIQFGSKLANKKQNAHDISEYFPQIYAPITQNGSTELR